MSIQVSRRHILRLGRFFVYNNRQITTGVNRLNLLPAITSSLNTKLWTPRHMSTQPKFESFNVQDAADFQQRVLGSSTPVLVDFHATWCGPCKLLGPRLESMVAACDGKVNLAKIDVDDNADLAMEYGVQSVPTVLGVKNGKVLDKFIGLQDDDQIKTFIERLVE